MYFSTVRISSLRLSGIAAVPSFGWVFFAELAGRDFQRFWKLFHRLEERLFSRGAGLRAALFLEIYLDFFRGARARFLRHGFQLPEVEVFDGGRGVFAFSSFGFRCEGLQVHVVGEVPGGLLR